MSVDTADAGAAAPASEAIAETAPETTTESAAPETAAAPEPAAPQSLEEALSETYDKIAAEGERQRGPDGKFLPRDPAPVEAQTNSADQPEETKPEPEVTPPAIEPPISWSAEMKAKFGTLPPEVATYVAQRDKESHDAITRFGSEKKGLEDKIKSYEPFDQLAQHYQFDFKRMGYSPVEAFAVLMNAHKMLESNPVQGLVQVASSYGVDLSGLLRSQAGQQGAMQPSPEVNALRAELNQVKGYLTEQQRQQFKAQQDAQAQAEAKQQEAVATLTSQIADFSKDKPHFALVEADLVDLIPSLKGKFPDDKPLDLLAKAYDKAIWANPSVRERILADQRKSEEAKRAEEAAKKAAAAKKSASVNVRSGEQGKAPAKNWTDTLEREAARLFAS